MANNDPNKGRDEIGNLESPIGHFQDTRDQGNRRAQRAKKSADEDA
jgi:hypothetical protein